MLQLLTKEEIFTNHVLECINSIDHDVATETDEEKVNFLYNAFISEYSTNISRYSTRTKAFEEWIKGMPTSFNTLIYNYEILEFLRSKDLVNGLTEDVKYETIESYWEDVAKAVNILFKKYNVEKPESVKIIISNGKIKDNLFYLPPAKLDRKTYEKVADVLKMIGGKWTGGKVQAFKFDKDPTELIKKYLNGEDINFKKKFQFFATPQVLAERIVKMANLQTGDKVLEPSAGQGAILKEINKRGITPSYFEIMDLNIEVIKENNINGVFLGNDFLKSELSNSFDKIIANPPFSKNQDIKHIMKMYDSLKEGGVLISIASKHWTFANDKESVKFREFVEENGYYETVGPGAFKESGTCIETVIITLRK